MIDSAKGSAVMKVALFSETKIVTMEVEGKSDKDLTDILTDWNKNNSKEQMNEIHNLKGKHLCKYCGELAQGEYEDLLCKDCRETFGHSFYSEL